MSNPVARTSEAILLDFDTRAHQARARLKDDRSRAIYDRAIAALDRSSILRMQDVFRAATERGEVLSGFKYFDLPHVLSKHLNYLTDLDLDQSGPLRILDIGAAGGHFMFMARLFGHEVTAADVSVKTFDEIARVYEMPIHHHRATVESPVALEGPFDIISLTGIALSQKQVGDTTRPWTIEEWTAFLSRLIDRLALPGRIYLIFNSRLFSADLAQAFEEMGADVERARYKVVFDLKHRPSWWVPADGPIDE